ncbi:MAG: FecR family protein [Spirochaetota bacterium]
MKTQFSILSIQFLSILLICTISCQKPKKITGAVILYSYGTVKTTSKKKVMAGTILALNDAISTSKKSFCDIQLLGIESQTTIRIQANSKFEIKQRSNENLPKVHQGKALFKVAGGKSDKNKLNVETSTSVAGIRGTQFEVSVDKEQNTKISTYEGEVDTRYRFAQIEDSQKLQGSEILEAVVAAATANTTPIPASQATVIRKKEIDKVYQENNLQTGDIKKSFSAEKFKASMLKQKEQQKLEKIPEKEMKSKLEELSELVALELSKLTSEENRSNAVKERNQKMEKVLQTRSKKVNTSSSSSSKNCLKTNSLQGFWDCATK